jgi:hypothetical protein
MACKYIYNGREYTKEELIADIAKGQFEVRPTDIFKSVATQKKQKQSDIVRDTLTVLYQRKKQAEDVIQAIKNSKDPKDVKLKKTAYYNGIINRTNDSIKELREMDADKQLDFILDLARIDAELVKAMYTSKSMTFNELQFANTIVETWKSLPEALGITDIYDVKVDPELTKQLEQNEVEYALLSRRSHAMAVELIKKASKGKLSEDDITKLVDTTRITEWTRELSTAGIPIANHLAYIMKEVNLKINKEHNKNYDLIDKMTQGIKDFSIFLKKQKNKDGVETLSLVTHYSQKFWDSRRSVNKKLTKDLEQAAGDKTKISLAWKTYNAWNESNTIAFNALLFINRNDYTDQQRDLEITRMKNLGFNKMEIDDIIVESFKRYEKFQNKLEEYQEAIGTEAAEDPSIIPQGMTYDEFVKAKVEEYDNLNNPLKYMDQKFYGGLITSYGGAKYTYLIPVKTLGGKDSGYYDANFAKIAADPKLYEFYTWYTKFISDNLSWLPQEEIEDLGSNFLPVIADRLAKEYGFTSLKESVNGLGDWFAKALSNNGFEEKTTVNPFSRKELRDFKSRFINEAVAVEERSTDLALIAKLFSDMALIYKHKNTVKAEVDTINDIIQNTKGSYKFDKKLNTLIRQDKDAKSIQSLADWTVRKGFYGLKSEDPLWQSNELFYDWKELIPLLGYKSAKAKEAQALSEDITKLNKALEDNPNLSDEDRQKILDARNVKIEQYYKLGGRKFSLTKAIDSGINNTRLTALGFAPFSAIRNLFVGKINNYMHSAGGRDFTKKEQRWANKLLTQTVANYWSRGKFETSTTRKIAGLLSDSGMVEGDDGMYMRTIADKKTPLNKFREMIPKAYTWLSGGDYHFKAEMMMSAMKFEKVKTSKGEVSFWDVLNEEREYNEAEYGPWDAAANGGLNFEDFFNKKMLKYRQLANKLHGATGKDVFVKGKDNALGRLGFMFKSWLPETVGVRWDPRHKDALLDRDEEGYYRTFFRMVSEKKAGVIKMMFNAMMGRDVGLQDEMELANFKKAVKEIQVLTTLWMSYLLLRAMTPDDDKDKKIYNLLVLRQLHDLNRDLTYYININSVSELQREAIPVIRTIRNWGGAAKAVAYYGIGVENEDGDLLYDGERTALKVTKVMPVLSNVNRVVYYAKQVD